jgi:ribosomal protein S12 methylthiotransferase accessory factor YcaO
MVSTPGESSATEARFNVNVATRSSTELVVVEHRSREYSESIRGLNGLALQRFLDGKLLDEVTVGRLSEILELQARIESLVDLETDREEQRSAIRARLDDVRLNLGALDATKDGHLRDRFVAQLEELDAKLVALDAESAEGFGAAKEADAAIETALAELGSST